MNKFIKLHSSDKPGVMLLFKVDMIELVVQHGNTTVLNYKEITYEVQETLDDIRRMINE